MPSEPTQTRMAASTSSGRRAVPVGGSHVYGASTGGFSAPKPKDNLFLWTVFLLAMVLVCMGTWVGTAVIFNHPEQPLNYNLLRRFKKVQPPQKFPVEAAPAGEFTTAGKLAARVAAMGPTEFRDFNAGLIRAFIRNFPISAKQPAFYLSGRFTIMDAYTLGPGDLFPSGVVALAVSTEDSKVLIEHVYSAPSATAPLIRRNLPTGTDIELQRTLQLTAVVHAERLTDGRLLLTVVPINYGSYGFKGTSSGFSLEPPPNLNLSAGWPVLKDKRREEANQSFIAFRQRSGTGALAARRRAPTPSSTTANTPSPVTGIDAPPPAPPAPGETPGLAVAAAATPAVASAPSPSPAAAATGAPARGAPTPVVAAAGRAPTLGPAASPSIPTAATVAMATPALPPNTSPDGGMRVERAQPVSAAPPGVLRAAPVNGNAPGGASLIQPVAVDRTRAGAGKEWATYTPGRQPPGRQLRAGEVASLGEQPATAEPLYLQGDFVVSATGVNPDTGDRQAVLRPRDPELSGRTRILVQYPRGRVLPAEGTALNRDAAHAYQITDVRRTADGGMLNVFAREITTE